MLIDCHNHGGASPRCTWPVFPYAHELRARIRQGDPHGVTHALVFPSPINLTFDFAAWRVTTFSISAAPNSDFLP